MGLLVVWRIASATALVVSAVSGKAVGQPQQLPGITVTAPPAPKTRSAPTPAITTASPATVASTTTPIADPSAIEAIDPRANNVGVAQSGSQGVVPREELEARPIYRTGDMLESVPGLVVTQHSGEGKANQYFLRGFNLDHGTDLAITYDGMPVNMRTARAMPTPASSSPS
jgi:outer membrane receptor protein involved in Fe transport